MLATSLACQTLNPGILLIGGAASLLPDIDHTESIVGRLFWPISNVVNKRFGHRTITHSLIAVLVVAAISAGIFIANQQVAIAFFAGYLSAIVGDMLTKSGVKLLWPNQNNWVILENPALRFTTGGIGEFILLLIIVSATITNFNAVSGGGIGEIASNYYSGLIGKPSAAIDFYNRHSNQYLIALKIDGVLASDRSNFDKLLRVIYIENNTIFVQDVTTGNLYKLGENIIVNRLRPTKEGLGLTTINKIAFDDEKLGTKIDSGEFYYFGTIQIEDVGSAPTLQPQINFLNPYEINGNAVTFNGAKREQIPFLNQYVTGELTEVKLDY
jgi:inner membrane protein